MSEDCKECGGSYYPRHRLFDRLVESYINSDVEPTREEKIDALMSVDVGDTTYLAMCEAGLYIIPEGTEYVEFFANGDDVGFKEYPVFFGKMLECTGKCDNYTYDVDIRGIKAGTYIDALTLAFLTFDKNVPKDTKKQNFYWKNHLNISYVQDEINFYYDEGVEAIAYPRKTSIIKYIKDGKIKMMDTSLPEDIDEDEEQTERYREVISSKIDEDEVKEHAENFANVAEDKGYDKKGILQILLDAISRIFKKKSV